LPYHSPRRILATCCAAHGLHDGLSDVNYVLLPILAQVFGLSLVQVGSIRSAWRAATSLFEIPAGLLAERFGARNLLSFGTACSGLAFLALGHSVGFTMILLTLFFAGFGSAFQHPLCSTVISHAYPEEGRRAALGTYNFSGDVGKFALGGAVSLLFIAGVPWQAPVMTFGGVALVGALAILVLLKGAEGYQKPDAIASGAGRRSSGWGIRHRRGFIALCLIEVIDGSTRTGFLTFVAFLMIAKHLPAGWAALSVPLAMVGGMAGKLACGFFAERLGICRTIVITEIATGAGILLMLVVPDIAAYLLLPLIGVPLNGTSSVLYATIGDLVEQDRLPRVFGLFYTLSSVCSLIVPLVFGAIGDVIGITATIALIGLLAFLTLPLCLILRPALAPYRAAI
jgi:FSR family fosmidomycin resistance protein-like MFS transporter